MANGTDKLTMKFEIEYPKPKILIVGHARHGKDTVAQILADGWDFKFQSSSLAAAEIVVFPVLSKIYGYETVEECFNDRVNHRAEWKDLITEYNSEDRTKLAKQILEDNNIYVGMRCKYELATCRANGLFDVIVWVGAEYRKEPEPTSSNTITKEMADYVIDNNGSITDLVLETFKFMKWYYTKYDRN
jgi:dephospho-CoA kinase